MDRVLSCDEERSVGPERHNDDPGPLSHQALGRLVDRILPSPGGPAERQGFPRVRREHVHQWVEVIGKRTRGSRIQNRSPAKAAGLAEGPADCLKGGLELAKEKIRPLDPALEGIEPFPCQRPVGAGRDRDLVSSGPIHHDECHSGRRGRVSKESLGRKPGISQMANDPVTDGVLAYLGDQTDLSAQAAGGQGLIGPFSTMGDEQRSAGNRHLPPGGVRRRR